MSSTRVSKQDPVLILGAGAWGLSTALHFHRNGFTNITVLERSEVVPSPYSAAYDLNKIVRAEYEDPFYTKLALDAIQGWKTPLFGPYFHQTGYIVAATGKAPSKAIEHLEAALANVSEHPAFEKGIKSLKGCDEFRDQAWQMTGPLNGFTGYINRLAGYAHSSDALHGIWLHCATLGIKFILGEEAGKVTELLYQQKRCVGAKTADGKSHKAKLVICALGAHVASLIPSIGHSVVARCWSVVHVQLTKSECDLLRGLPVLNVRDLGFYFEPDPETRLFKLCPLGAGYTNPGADGVSLPPGDLLPPPQDFIPAQDERKLRRLLQETLPWMADRPFVDQKFCWFADTKDSNFCIDFVPDTEGSLIALSGDSGHGFKMMPVFGEWVVDLVNKGKQAEPRWQWRHVKSGSDWGNAVSWRIGEARELKDLIKEKQKLERARL